MSSKQLYAADVTKRPLSGSSKWQTDNLHVFPEQSTGDIPTMHQGLVQQRYTPSYSKLLRWFQLEGCYITLWTATETALSEHCTTAVFKSTERTAALLFGCSTVSLLLEQHQAIFYVHYSAYSSLPPPSKQGLLLIIACMNSG